jgi:hypothetical protein
MASEKNFNFVLSFLREVLSLIAALSVLIYYWGYLALNTPLRAVFGVSLSFLSQDYWQAGLEYLLQMTMLLVPGCIAGLSVVARNPDFEKNRLVRITTLLVGVLSLTLYAVALTSHGTDIKLYLMRVSLVGLGYLLTIVVAATGYLHMLLADQDRVVLVAERLMESQDHELAVRANSPELLRLLRSGLPNDRLLAVERAQGQDLLAERLGESRRYFDDVKLKRRQARMYLTLMTVLCMCLMMVFIPITKDYVVESAVKPNWESYPAVLIVTNKTIPELVAVEGKTTEPMYRVRLILRTDGQVFIASTDVGTPVVLPASEVVRLLPASH